MVRSHEACALRHGHERADVVEEIDKEEDKDNLERVEAQRATNVEVKCRVAKREWRERHRVPVHLTEDNAQQHRPEHTDEHRCAHAEGLQHGDQHDANYGE